MKVLKYVLFVFLFFLFTSTTYAIKLNVGGGAFFPAGDLEYDTGYCATAGVMFSLETKYNLSTGLQINYAAAEHEDNNDQSIEILKITQYLRKELGRGLFLKGGFSIYRVEIDAATDTTSYEPGFSVGVGGSIMSAFEINAVYNVMIDNNGSSPDYGDNYWTVTLSVLY